VTRRAEPRTAEIDDKAKNATKATITTYEGGKDGAEVVLNPAGPASP
jgi:hypothetical protein